jgi:hypothetical protein
VGGQYFPRRFNLRAPVEFEYAASADVPIVSELRIGMEALGERGTTRNFLLRAEHLVGAAAKLEIEGLGPEIELGGGYLAIARAKNTSDGQLRLGPASPRDSSAYGRLPQAAQRPRGSVLGMLVKRL